MDRAPSDVISYLLPFLDERAGSAFCSSCKAAAAFHYELEYLNFMPTDASKYPCLSSVYIEHKECFTLECDMPGMAVRIDKVKKLTINATRVQLLICYNINEYVADWSTCTIDTLLIINDRKLPAMDSMSEKNVRKLIILDPPPQSVIDAKPQFLFLWARTSMLVYAPYISGGPFFSPGETNIKPDGIFVIDANKPNIEKDIQVFNKATPRAILIHGDPSHLPPIYAKRIVTDIPNSKYEYAPNLLALYWSLIFKY